MSSAPWPALVKRYGPSDALDLLLQVQRTFADPAEQEMLKAIEYDIAIGQAVAVRLLNPDATKRGVPK